MPSAHPPRQPESPGVQWFRSEPGQRLIACVQRLATPELTRVFGHCGLYLRLSASMPADLSGNMLANVISLHREQEHLAGSLHCLESELPIGTASLSLVYASFMLETSRHPEALMREIARLLKPEGTALIISVNHWSPARLRWLLQPPPGISKAKLERLAHDAGLEVVRHHFLGPFWPSATGSNADQAGNRWLDGFRAVNLTVIRRREAALTPVRKATPAVSLRPGMSVG